MITKSSCLGMGLLLLTACTTTKVLDEWRNTDVTGTRFGHLAVVALFKQDQTRRMFEDEFAWQISNQGQMVTRSYNLVPSLNESTTGRIATIAKAVGTDGVLVIRMVNSKQPAKTADDNSSPVPMNLSGFLQHSWKDNYDPPDQVTNAVMNVESRLFDVKNEKLVWSLATESKNQFGLKWEINLLAKRVLDKLKDATRTK
ncbi:MAG: hypothetical protein KJ964_07060 [Verrucomicrobia bacterium]|nr:hypothetical protein [Verrucomicrobiota bacterium]MBU1733960.1 hypothetical protein [Verrucomicrobiota bacterium]MBU1856810.1 hypothetical protein [Verrucomicrobiota bacterium]